MAKGCDLPVSFVWQKPWSQHSRVSLLCWTKFMSVPKDRQRGCYPAFFLSVQPARDSDFRCQPQTSAR